MKLVYEKMGHILKFGEGYVNELIVENKKMFFEMVNGISMQAEGMKGDFVLSINDKPKEISKYIEIVMQFAPFQLNKKTLLTKLYAALEQKAISSENYVKTGELMGELASYLHSLSEEFPFDIDCKKISIGPIIKALSPEIEENDKSTLEKIFAYMELVRELDRERLFVMINMRAYFDDNDMESFIKSATLHDFKVLLIESVSYPPLQNVKRSTIDEDLCEF